MKRRELFGLMGGLLGTTAVAPPTVVSAFEQLALGSSVDDKDRITTDNYKEKTKVHFSIPAVGTYDNLPDALQSSSTLQNPQGEWGNIKISIQRTDKPESWNFGTIKIAEDGTPVFEIDPEARRRLRSRTEIEGKMNELLRHEGSVYEPVVSYPEDFKGTHWGHMGNWSIQERTITDVIHQTGALRHSRADWYFTSPEAAQRHIDNTIDGALKTFDCQQEQNERETGLVCG